MSGPGNVESVAKGLVLLDPTALPVLTDQVLKIRTSHCTLYSVPHLKRLATLAHVLNVGCKGIKGSAR